MRALIARIAKIVGAWGLITILFFVFDDVLYPAAILTWGWKLGGTIMATLAVSINLVMLISYERAGEDWLGVNVLEDTKATGEARVQKVDTWFETRFESSLLFAAASSFIAVAVLIPSRLFLIVLWMLKKNDVFAFIALNIAADPFVAITFLRHGRFGGLTKKDWLIFTASVVFSNGYWIGRSYLVVILVKYGWIHIVS